MLHGLLRQALGQVEVGRAEGLFSLGNNQTVTDSPVGSPMAISPHLVTLMDLWAQRQSIIRQTKRRNGGKRQAKGQLAMF